MQLGPTQLDHRQDLEKNMPGGPLMSRYLQHGRKVMTVPFDEHPYSAMASFFKTDEGLEIFKSTEKKLS